VDAQSRTICIIAPHPDDEVLGCGGTLLKLLTKGYRVRTIFLTSGDAIQKTREKEARAAARKLGTALPVFLRMKTVTADGGLRKLIQAIERVSPAATFYPHAGDGDSDHQAANSLSKEAVWRYNEGAPADRRIGAALMYEVHKPMHHYGLVVDISDVMTKKLSALKCYESQLKRIRWDKAIEGLNMYRGELHEGTRFAEVFQIHRVWGLDSINFT